MCYDNYHCDMIDKECILHILSTLPYLSILKPLFLPPSLSLSPSLLSPSLPRHNQLLPTLSSLPVACQNVNRYKYLALPYLRYLRYLRYLSQVHVTQRIHA